MAMDLTGITNKNEYYTNHYFSSIFEENAAETISAWRTVAKDNEEIKTPWSMLRDNAKQYYPIHDRYTRTRFDLQTLWNIQTLANAYLASLGYPEAKPENILVEDNLEAPVYLEITKNNGAPLLWVLLGASSDPDVGIMESKTIFTDKAGLGEPTSTVYADMLSGITNEELATKILFSMNEPPRFLLFIGMNQIALIDRNKWNEKRYLQFELEDIFSRREETTLQAMAVLLHKDSLCPDEGTALLDELDSNSQKHAAGVSQDLKYALRECIELLGNEVLYDMSHRQGVDLNAEPVDAGQLTIECLRYMYRMLFMLFIEARPELGYAPIKAQSYLSGYSLESLRDIADNIRDDVDEVGNGYYLHETLAKLYDLIYTGYPKKEEDILKYSAEESLHDTFVISPLKAHIFDPDYTALITKAKLRNSVMLRIIDLMSLTRSSGKRNSRRGRISYANLGINQLGAVYEALLSYRGFIAEEDLYEVKRAGDNFNELDVGYFVKENELDQYTEDERVRYESGENKGKLRMYKKGSFIYRLAGREREKSASYYTPEVLTKCLVKYALKELLEGKTADEILNLTICEPAMGSAAFLNEAINQLAEAYVDRKQKELGETISYEKRFTEVQKVKMFIADRNVYGVDLNPIAVELAEVSLWLNTIFEGGFVPWFGTQLVNGNSLIGARRQCYHTSNLSATSKGLRWYENAPDRVPVGTKRKPKTQVYHFLLGDTGMCNYGDKVIKSLEPDNIKKMVNWNKKFTEPISDDDMTTLLRLSATIDELWEAQIALRKEVSEKTQDVLSVYGHVDTEIDSHTTIRQKDKILSEIYKSEHMKNAGPYARLKFAMDYWCALWFWPIEKADLLPSRSEFLFDMSLILEGTTESVVVTNTVNNKKHFGQISLFPTEMEQMELDLWNLYDGMMGEVDIPALRKQNPRLDLAARIAEQNKFMHWELEFADLFAERGGFDLVVGNPPWIKIEWNEQNVLSDSHPLFAVKNLTATQTSQNRDGALTNRSTREAYFSEYESMAGQQQFLNAAANYSMLKGQQSNLYKCFLPQAWMIGSAKGISCFIHPDGIFDDPKGGDLRENIYPRLRYHFNFRNELMLFQEILHLVTFSLNIYSNCELRKPSFDIICNLFAPKTIDSCYESDDLEPVAGIKKGDSWNIDGHSSRIIKVTKDELMLFARLFDGSDNWIQARLPVLHAVPVVDALRCFDDQPQTLADLKDNVFTTELWHETNAQKDSTIIRKEHFSDNHIEMIYSGPHIGVANPLYKTSRRVCKLHSDYDSVDISYISESYMPRSNYMPKCPVDEYYRRAPVTKWGKSILDEYKIITRRMLSQTGERTLMPTIAPPKVGFINTVFGIAMTEGLPAFSGEMASIPYDFFIKATGKSDGRFDTLSKLPLITDGPIAFEIAVRSLLLNTLTQAYAPLWKKTWKKDITLLSWAKDDFRLNNARFTQAHEEWNWNIPLRSDYERRQALVEVDVLTAIAIGMTLEQLKTIYRIQFPVLQSYEADTWYDSNGKIVFTNNRSLVGVGFSRPEWENGIKDAPAGKKFYRTITDDTLPGGPVERTIEYVAPFDRCDREKDYETAWKFFEKKYGKQTN